MNELSKRASLVALSLMATTTMASAADIKLVRFFGDCQAEFGTVTNPDDAYGECGIITALTNQFNAENKIGAHVDTQTVDWGAYYTQLSASYTTGDIPDIGVMHASDLVNYTDRGLATPIGEQLAAAGVDPEDWVDQARNSVTSDGEIYALPFDIHAVLMHVNLGLMKEAGLVNEDGSAKLPTSLDEVISMGKTFQEKTGKHYIAMESQATDVSSMRLFMSLIWQQGDDLVSEDGKTATVDTPEGLRAAQFIKALYDNDLIDPGLDYNGAEQAFLNGDAGLFINGTWVVNSYATQAENGTGLIDYAVYDIPTFFDEPGVFSNSHTWFIPTDESRTPEEEEAAIAFLTFLNENGYQWARTGHLPVRRSVIESEEFRALPDRTGYAGTADAARSLPPVKNARGIFNDVAAELSTMWQAGIPPEESVANANDATQRILRRNR
ncbi:extracellular solute-binding protein [uncultured Martelella sp.]|uniref:extracellular solute-binding protein n=1 Tax=uncultured Martelella sp. TaxID=392331 RepID=UPI0029C75EB6|nr:extracellular solute-binding protein [uncultured Martelella sp.]